MSSNCLVFHTYGGISLSPTKAFDSIHRGKMDQILLAYSLPKETITAIMIHQGLKVERNELIHTTCICIIIVAIDIVAVQQRNSVAL